LEERERERERERELIDDDSRECVNYVGGVKMYPCALGETPGDYRELGYGGTEGVGVARNGSLVIPRVSRDHAGFYLCQASNGIGPGLSKLIRLTVHGKIFT